MTKYVCRDVEILTDFNKPSPFEHIGIRRQIPVEILMKTSNSFKVGGETFDPFSTAGTTWFFFFFLKILCEFSLVISYLENLSLVPQSLPEKSPK